MTKSASAFTDEKDTEIAARSIASQITAGLDGSSPDALIVFASSKHDYSMLLRTLNSLIAPRHLVGCSSAGEFIRGSQSEGSISALALTSSDMRFSSAIGRGLREDRETAARQLAGSLESPESDLYPHRSVLLLADALAGHTDDLIESLTAFTAGRFQFFGGGAGDDAKFSQTHVFHGTEALTDAAVGLEISSKYPIGIGVQHGWTPVGNLMRATEADGMRLISLNAIPACDVIQEYAESTGQPFDRNNPIPFFLQNVLAIQTKAGYKLRVPLTVQSDGSLVCASNIPTGSTVSFMKATSSSSVEAAKTAVDSALRQLDGLKPGAALFFDCVATRLRMGHEFGAELRTLEHALGDADLAGCNTYGQIARVEGQFSGFHNCTAVVCVIPESKLD